MKGSMRQWRSAWELLDRYYCSLLVDGGWNGPPLASFRLRALYLWTNGGPYRVRGAETA
jgi:hypothetical protein